MLFTPYNEHYCAYFAGKAGSSVTWSRTLLSLQVIKKWHYCYYLNSAQINSWNQAVLLKDPFISYNVPLMSQKFLIILSKRVSKSAPSLFLTSFRKQALLVTSLGPMFISLRSFPIPYESSNVWLACIYLQNFFKLHRYHITMCPKEICGSFGYFMTHLFLSAHPLTDVTEWLE